MATVLITGAAQRIGRAIALHFAHRGGDIVAHYHTSEEAALILKSEIETLGGKCWLIQANLAEEAMTSQLMTRIKAEAGAVDILVNNASTFQYDQHETVTRHSWDYHMEPNLRAPLILSQEFARLMGNGLIVNLIDQRVWNLTPHYLSYSISKYALWGLTQVLALSMGPSIRVNAIGPGPTLKNVNQTELQFAQQCAATPLGRGGSPEEIALAVEMFWKLPSVTGQMLAIDGGQHLGWKHPSPTLHKDD